MLTLLTQNNRIYKVIIIVHIHPVPGCGFLGTRWTKKKKFRTETWASLVDVNMDILTGIEEIFFSSSSFSSPLVFIAIYCHLVEQFLIALPGKVT